ncbi:hypothetical protein EES39_26860 [Streptomyces sp. ADI92-24]|nr:hypothetical protein EDD95_4091 [Streptomyces sp. CEV 2-1]RPK39516.1 hypothetical protein EES39_26860 [Streptomyces sp. ADI92-24]
MTVLSAMPFAPVLAFSPADPWHRRAGTHDTKRLPEGRACL